MDEKKNGFDEWAILELMGHRRLAGRITDAVIGGGSFLRIDIPGKNGRVTTQYYSPGSVYCITPTTEEIARSVAAQSEPEPVHRWELPQLEKPKASEKCGNCGVYREITNGVVEKCPNCGDDEYGY